MRLRSVVVASLLAIVSSNCGDPPAQLDGGTAGAGAGSGSAGAGGAAGSGGAAGAGGAAGTGGSAGAGGSAGTGGTAGGGGSAGTGGAAGSAGAGGTAGSGATDAGPSDDAGTDAGADLDAGPLDAGLPPGATCTTDSACQSSFCGPLADGGRACSSPCTASTDCGDVALRCTPDDAGIGRCWPRFPSLCRPCASDLDCRPADPRDVASGNRCRSLGASQGSFCAATCATQACPAGFTCTPVDGGSPLCLPTSGVCACAPAFEGATTPCASTNDAGVCSGQRACVDGGLTACSAATPAAELCNGLDDDCDGTTDQGGDALCADGANCTTDVCGGDAGCSHVVAPGSCLISGTCYAEDAGDPSNPCGRCTPDAGSTTFTARPGCAIGGACYAPGAVNPASACEECTPATSTTAWSPRLSACQIAGQCYLSGQINPAVACLSCQPTVTRTSWTVLSNACLIGGTCYGSGQVNPAQACQSCQPNLTRVNWSPRSAGTVCNPSDLCFNDAVCAAGVCPARTYKQDSNEPNDTSGTATVTMNTTDCDSDQRTVTGMLSGSADHDWYRLQASDNFGCSVDPRLSVNSGGISVRACAYVACLSGTNSALSCGNGAAASTSLPGYLGCCLTGANPTFTFDYACDCGTFCVNDNTAQVRVEVSNLASSAACVSTSAVIKF